MDPDSAGRSGHIHLLDPKGSQCIHQCIGHNRQCSNGASLTGSLDAQGVSIGQHLIVLRDQFWKVASARHSIVHERTGNELTVLIVDNLLAQYLPYALSNPAVDLPFDQHRIDDAPYIIHDTVTGDLPIAGLRVHLDFADVASVRKAWLVRRNHALFRKPLSPSE